MYEHILIAASRLSDEALLAEMKVLSGQSRDVTVKLIAHLVEIARRGIYRAEGPGKLFGYLTRVLRFSEAAAWNRIQAARAVRRFPVVLDLPERYRLQLTVDEQTHEDLRCLQDLMRREIPDGDPALIVARALRLLREQAEKKAFAATPIPRPPRGTKPGSRDIPAAVQRTVWRRDGGQCCFVAGSGRRCEDRSYLEYHHADVPYVRGGEATVENISLRCRAHNVYEAELLFGPYVSRVRETPAPYAAATCSGTNLSASVSPR